MRIDYLTIFPDYLAPLELSLAGKARAKGLLDLHVHDLRRWAHDRHHTVDGTPYGGGAGMVLRPEPWGEAFDELIPLVPEEGSVGHERPTLIVTTPSGEPFSQALARELAGRERLIVACGRYEGIDQRVLDHAATLAEVREISIGDYVLNGGEAAALVITEAVCRLIPGFMGNPESLNEESHEGGLLEGPVYTKPATWRGRDVPPVLLSGDHAEIDAWRHDQAVRRTAQRRPDLVHPSTVIDGVEVRLVEAADAGELLTLQRACWVQEQQANPGIEIDALTESLEDVRDWIAEGTVFVARNVGRLVGAVRGRLHGTAWDIGRLMVAPDLHGRGLGRMLLSRMESAAPDEAASFELFTGAGSVRNQKMYKKAGYRLVSETSPGVVRMSKRR